MRKVVPSSCNDAILKTENYWPKLIDIFTSEDIPRKYPTVYFSILLSTIIIFML